MKRLGIEFMRYTNFISALVIAGTPVAVPIFFLDTEQATWGFVVGVFSTLSCVALSHFMYNFANKVDDKLTDMRDGIIAKIN